MLEIIEAYGHGEDAQWRRLWSTKPGILSLGTDPREWWDSSEVAIALHAKHLVERGAATFAVDKLAAYQEGSVGWATVSARVTWQHGVDTLRLTGIFHLERGTW